MKYHFFIRNNSLYREILGNDIGKNLTPYRISHNIKLYCRTILKCFYGSLILIYQLWISLCLILKIGLATLLIGSYFDIGSLIVSASN